MKKIITYIFLLLFFLNFNTTYSQVYLGEIEKEGILISETLKNSKFSPEYLQEKLDFLSKKYGDNVIFDNLQDEFKDFTNIKIGEKYFISCSENLTSESVSGYTIYNFYGMFEEFYPLISNKTNLCKYSSYEYPEKYKNLVIISKDSLFEKINFTPMISGIPIGFKQRILQDVKNFEVYRKESSNFEKEYITEVNNEDIIFFRGSFCNKSEAEYFVTYLRQSESDYINSNYVMNYDAKVIEFFTTPREVFEYRKIIGICDYDNDGLDEILIDVGYYEGGGYELWKYKNSKFIKIAEGFYFGV
ncbi:MAG: hypothetical protein WAT71_07725 [Ignavibacteria bacterium]